MRLNRCDSCGAPLASVKCEYCGVRYQNSWWDIAVAPDYIRNEDGTASMVESHAHLAYLPSAILGDAMERLTTPASAIPINYDGNIGDVITRI